MGHSTEHAPRRYARILQVRRTPKSAAKRVQMKMACSGCIPTRFAFRQLHFVVRHRLRLQQYASRLIPWRHRSTCGIGDAVDLRRSHPIPAHNVCRTPKSAAKRVEMKMARPGHLPTRFAFRQLHFVVRHRLRLQQYASRLIPWRHRSTCGIGDAVGLRRPHPIPAHNVCRTLR